MQFYTYPPVCQNCGHNLVPRKPPEFGKWELVSSADNRGALRRKALLATAAFLVVSLVAGLLTLGASALPAKADSISVDTSPGTAAPPPTLGPYTMTPFEADARELFQLVSDVPAPEGRTLQFDQLVDHYRIGDGWATWSHGYTGDVYFVQGTRLVMSLPADTKAFYFYAEPNVFDTFDVTATASDGTTSGPISVAGRSGAQYFGFYATGGATLSTITVTVDPGALGFAVGEFGIAYQKAPQSKADCKRGGYKEFGFKNQGLCISSLQRSAKTTQ